jgi:hypothetical protein
VYFPLDTAQLIQKKYIYTHQIMHNLVDVSFNRKLKYSYCTLVNKLNMCLNVLGQLF